LGLDVVKFIEEYARKGVRYVICTDIAKDGMLQGPSVDLYKEILRNTNVQLIASGGVTSVDDLHLLKEIGCEGAIIGKAIYEGQLSLKELMQFNG
jgi:phosphoribosylformimino-5-aminoimidazole carboxamide ribotide isomerase